MIIRLSPQENQNSNDLTLVKIAICSIKYNDIAERSLKIDSINRAHGLSFLDVRTNNVNI